MTDNKPWWQQGLDLVTGLFNGNRDSSSPSESGFLRNLFSSLTGVGDDEPGANVGGMAAGGLAGLISNWLLNKTGTRTQSGAPTFMTRLKSLLFAGIIGVAVTWIVNKFTGNNDASTQPQSDSPDLNGQFTAASQQVRDIFVEHGHNIAQSHGVELSVVNDVANQLSSSPAFNAAGSALDAADPRIEAIVGQISQSSHHTPDDIRGVVADLMSHIPGYRGAAPAADVAPN